MNDAERIHALEGLLARIQKNGIGQKPASPSDAPDEAPLMDSPFSAGPLVSFDAGLSIPPYAAPAVKPPVDNSSWHDDTRVAPASGMSGVEPLPIAEEAVAPPEVAPLSLRRLDAPRPASPVMPPGLPKRAPLTRVPTLGFGHEPPLPLPLPATRTVTPAPPAPPPPPEPPPQRVVTALSNLDHDWTSGDSTPPEAPQVLDLSLDDDVVFIDDEELPRDEASVVTPRAPAAELTRLHDEEWRLLEEEARRIEAEQRTAAALEEAAREEAAREEAASVMAELRAERRGLLAEAVSAAHAADSERAAQDAEEHAEASRIAAQVDAEEARLAAPASARQPRDEQRAPDEGLVDLDDEHPPESGEVESQRVPSTHEPRLRPSESSALRWPEEATVALPLAALLAREQDAAAARAAIAEFHASASAKVPSADGAAWPSASFDVHVVPASPPPPAPTLAALAPLAPRVLAITADVVARPAVEGDAARFVGAMRAAAPASFGELLDASLALGE